MVTSQTIHLGEVFNWHIAEGIVTVNAGCVQPPQVVGVAVTRKRILTYQKHCQDQHPLLQGCLLHVSDV